MPQASLARTDDLISDGRRVEGRLRPVSDAIACLQDSGRPSTIERRRLNRDAVAPMGTMRKIPDLGMA